MGTAITTKRGTFYAYLQANNATVSSFTAPTITTDAIRVIECNWALEGGPVVRDGHDEAHDGGLKPLAGPVTRVCTVKVERRSSVTSGDASTWQQNVLWKMCPPIVVDDSGSTIALTPTAGRLQGLFGSYGTIAYYERNGKRKAAINCFAIPVSTEAEAGGIIVDTFEIRGQPVNSASAATDDVAQISTHQVTTPGTGSGSFIIKDDTGRSVTGTYAAGGTVNDTATNLEAAVETARGSATWFTETVATDTVTFTSGEVGRPLTITITVPSGGAGTDATGTANANYSTYPTYANDSELPTVFEGATVTHQVEGEDVLNISKFALNYGYTLTQKKIGGDAAGTNTGYAIARVSGAVAPTLAISCDAQSGADYDVDESWRAGTAVSFTLVDSPHTFTCPQGVIMDPSETENEGDRSWDYTLRLYSTGSSTDMWSQDLA
jgi:hypothetical protein